MLSGVSRTVTSFGVAIALCASPALASALLSPASVPLNTGVSQTPIQSLSPMVALSVFGSQASVTALCAANAAAAASANSADAVQSPAPAAAPPSSGTATSGNPNSGCVLPVTDVPATAMVGEAPPPGFVPFAIGPLLAGLAAVGGTAAAIASQDSGNDSDPPVSVN